MNIFFTSDEHVDHYKVIELDNRPFTSLEEMVEAQVNNHNAKVGKRDLTVHLGDVAFRDPAKYINRLNGKHWLVFGNHDRRNKLDSFEKVSDVLLMKGMELFLSHYAHLTWPQKQYGFMHLFGHSHGRLDGPPGSMDVGQNIRNYTPMAYEEVVECLREKRITI